MTDRAGADPLPLRELKPALRDAVSRQQSGQAHGEVGKFLKQVIGDYRRHYIDRHPRGDLFAVKFAAALDAILTALIEVQDNVTGLPFAVVAVGGYGRGELAPYSDVDLLFLHSAAAAESVQASIDPILYPLWDSGLKLGYSVHTPTSAVAFAKDDIIARTTFLDARYLAGDNSILAEFKKRFDAMRGRTGPAFVAAKLSEQEERQSRSLETRYLVEPDVKEGKGGLRDLQTIEWIYKYVYGAPIGDSQAIAKVLDQEEIRSLNKVKRFLLSVRVHMHDLLGYADETLSFNLQPKVAERLGYAERKDMSPAERLMRHYFVNAMEVGRLTRILCARLEEEQAKRLPRPPKVLPKYLQSDEAGEKPNIRIHNGRLDFKKPAAAQENPVDLFRYFRAFAKSPSIDFHPNALAVISASLPLITSDVRRDPVIAAIFAGILTKSKRSVRALRVMIETGLLGKYIPAIGELVGRIDYGLYRRFTIDEHVLRCLSLLEDVANGEYAESHPISSDIVSNTKNLYEIHLAVLLHETIWTVNGQSPEACETLITRIARRLGFDATSAQRIGWVGANSGLMARTAERRNLNDSYTISTFAEQVGDLEKLKLLVVVTVCHLRVVGIHSWDDVARRQVTELYHAACEWFEGGDVALSRRVNTRARQSREKLRNALDDWDVAEREGFLRRVDGPMISSVDPEILVRFARLVRAAEVDGQPAAVTVTPRDRDMEALVFAEDRQGLIAQLAGQVATLGLSVRSMNAFTTIDGKALDILIIQLPEGRAGDDPDLAGKLHASLLKSAKGAELTDVKFSRRIGDRRPIFEVAPIVHINQEASDTATVIDTECLDRPGLLYDVTSALSALDLTIVSAHIATFGERAVDAFYVQDSRGRKLADKDVIRRARRRLLQILEAPKA